MREKYKTPENWDDMPAVVYDIHNVYATRILERQSRDMEEKLQKIRAWCESRPSDSQPRPDLQQARKILEENGLSLDAIAADCLRHILSGLQDFIDE